MATIHKVTKITILPSGNIAPNKVVDLGKQHENVGDLLQFDIPTEYHGYHHYLAFYMKKQDTILLPVNNVGGVLQFEIGSRITRNSGTYEIIFLATESAVEHGDIDEAKKVFVSTTFYGNVVDNFLEDPVTDEEMDPNLKVLYDELNDLIKEVEADLEADAYVGASYIPDVDEDGVLSWTRSDGKNINIPDEKNITGPQGIQGPYYEPEVIDGQLEWKPSQENMPEVSNTNLNEMVETASNSYLDANLSGVVSAAVDAKFRFEWDATNQILKIYTEDYEVKEEETPTGE